MTCLRLLSPSVDIKPFTAGLQTLSPSIIRFFRGGLTVKRLQALTLKPYGRANKTITLNCFHLEKQNSDGDGSLSVVVLNCPCSIRAESALPRMALEARVSGGRTGLFFSCQLRCCKSGKALSFFFQLLTEPDYFLEDWHEWIGNNG